jgi:hypothetical protein
MHGLLGTLRMLAETRQRRLEPFWVERLSL